MNTTLPSDLPSLSVRPAKEADIPAVQALAGRIWRAHYPGIISLAQIEYMLGKMYSHEALSKHVEDPAHRFWLAENAQGQPLGFLAISEEGEGYFIHKCYVAPEAHGKGAGQALMDTALSGCTPGKPVRLRVNRINIRPVNFYFKNGFIIENICDTDFGEGYFMNDFTMVRHAKRA